MYRAMRNNKYVLLCSLLLLVGCDGGNVSSAPSPYNGKQPPPSVAAVVASVAPGSPQFTLPLTNTEWQYYSLNIDEKAGETITSVVAGDTGVISDTPIGIYVAGRYGAIYPMFQSGHFYYRVVPSRATNLTSPADDVYTYTLRDAAGNKTDHKLVIRLTGGDVSCSGGDTSITAKFSLPRTNTDWQYYSLDINEKAGETITSVVAGDTGVISDTPIGGFVAGRYGAINPMYQFGHFYYQVVSSRVANINCPVDDIYTYTLRDAKGNKTAHKLVIRLTGGDASGGSGGGGGGMPTDTSGAAKTPKEKIAALEDSGEIPKLDRTPTLTGIDANNNGVRDDIEAFITKNYTDSAQRAAAMQGAKALQSSLTVDKKDMGAVKAVSRAQSRAVHCLFLKFDDENVKKNPVAVGYALEAMTTNTKQRLVAYLQFSKALDGTVLSMTNGDTCE